MTEAKYIQPPLTAGRDTNAAKRTMLADLTGMELIAQLAKKEAGRVFRREEMTRNRT